MLGYQGDHGPQDHGLVAYGQPFAVAGAAAVSDDPGQGALGDPAAGQLLEGVRVARADDLQLDLQAGGPGGELAGVSRTSSGQPAPPQSLRPRLPARIDRQRAGAVGLGNGRPALGPYSKEEMSVCRQRRGNV